MKRKCKICNKVRRTTNNENPYVCELCLRSKGRDMLLAKSMPVGVVIGAICGIVFIVGLIVGWWLL